MYTGIWSARSVSVCAGGGGGGFYFPFPFYRLSTSFLKTEKVENVEDKKKRKGKIQFS
jgi:hypothetical protein